MKNSIKFFLVSYFETHDCDGNKLEEPNDEKYAIVAEDGWANAFDTVIEEKGNAKRSYLLGIAGEALSGILPRRILVEGITLSTFLPLLKSLLPSLVLDFLPSAKRNDDG